MKNVHLNVLKPKQIYELIIKQKIEIYENKQNCMRKELILVK